MIKFIVDFTIYASPVLSLLYLIGFVKFDKPYKVFTIYLVLMSIIQLTSEYIIKTGGSSNLFLSHYYFLFQFVTLSLFFYYLLKKKWIIGVLIGGCLFFGYQYINDSSLYNRYNSNGIAISQSILVVYSLLYLFKSLTEKTSFVLVSIGLFIFLLSSIVIFASGNLFFNSDTPKDFFRFLNDMNAVLYLVFQILIFIEWWRNYRPRKV